MILLQLDLPSNSSHLRGIDGKIYCIPQYLLPAYYPLTVPLEWYLAFRGDGILQFFQWLFGWQVTTNEFITYEHFRYTEKRICHLWNGVEYTYHDDS